MPALIGGSKDEDWDVSHTAVRRRWACIGPEAREAVPALIAALRDEVLGVSAHGQTR